MWQYLLIIWNIVLIKMKLYIHKNRYYYIIIHKKWSNWPVSVKWKYSVILFTWQTAITCCYHMLYKQSKHELITTKIIVSFRYTNCKNILLDIHFFTLYTTVVLNILCTHIVVLIFFMTLSLQIINKLSCNREQI